MSCVGRDVEHQHGSQLATLVAINVVIGVLSSNLGIYSKQEISLMIFGFGWLVLTIINVSHCSSEFSILNHLILLSVWTIFIPPDRDQSELMALVSMYSVALLVDLFHVARRFQFTIDAESKLPAKTAYSI